MIKIENITKSYGEKENRVNVLKGISLEINDGDFAVILGASGSGKSTLLNVMSGLERPDSGKVSYGSEDITVLSDDKLTSFRKDNTGFIFQQYYLLPNMTAVKNEGNLWVKVSALGTLLMHSVLGDILRYALLSPGHGYVPKARPYIVAYDVPPKQKAVIGVKS